MSDSEGLRSLDWLVRGMGDAACLQRVRQALAALPGVEAAGIDVRPGRVRLDYYAEALSAETIRASLESLGLAIQAPGPRSRNPLRRFLERMGDANERVLDGKRLDCCKISENKN